MTRDATHWYAVHTKPRKESQVRLYLESQDIETYLPMLHVPNKRYPGRTREEPFLARYLFVHLDLLGVPLSSINWSPGVNRVVSFGGQPAEVPDEVIQWLMGRLRQAETSQVYRGLPLQPDDRLRITGGPLEGLEAIFDQCLSSEDRARVFVELLGRLTSCEIPLVWLERI